VQEESEGNSAKQLVLQTVLSDSATPSNLNASNFLTVKDNIKLNPIFGMLSSRAIQNIPDMARLSLMVKKLDAIKLYEIAESGNTACKAYLVAGSLATVCLAVVAGAMSVREGTTGDILGGAPGRAPGG